ncbi:50S ribosomal protein L17 [Candidatus Epulonipiscium fishelsonii]|uniref:50S ribosomal protein L17 n=1 Tax=Candidatus Epulonipiscium fishelsonii TaxID=77094 RepID=A0ACC8XG02_9FIRM|nr:50S ribosomal protein L17 [Epulopiscium sp. SCG-D08WGA-EpuloA1]OON95404.1 MAG: 50S ribosomal protein L17 [Epulopiscium sp. AS2M-Bin002]
MAQRKLGRTASQRKALLRNQVTNLLYHGKIKTTDSKAKEIRKIAEGIIASAIKEKDNYEEITITAKVVKKDENGNRIKEVIDGKKKPIFENVEKTIKKDSPSRLHARRQMLKVLYPVTEVNVRRRRQAKNVDMVDKLFSEIAPKYVDRNGGYTRITKLGPRKGDAAEEVIIELV